MRFNFETYGLWKRTFKKFTWSSLEYLVSNNVGNNILGEIDLIHFVLIMPVIKNKLA